MQFAIAGSDTRPLWAAAMSSSGANGVYYLLEYHELHAPSDGRCLAYIARGGGDTLFYPFLLRPIGRVGDVPVAPGMYDIGTVYGYSGPVATTGSSEFLAQAWRGFDTWCREHGVVAEFVRFNPLLQTERFATFDTEVVADRPTVEIRVDVDSDASLLNSYAAAKRRKIRKATQHGLAFEEIAPREGIPIFRRLYEETMRRVSATESYFYPDSYYRAIEETLAQHTRMFVVRDNGTPVAADLCFTYGDTVCSHLTGSATAAHSLAPNDLMVHGIASWSRRHGFKRFHLGGGRISSTDDPLFCFKKQFASRLLQFHLGKRIHDQEQYESLCRLWSEQFADPGMRRYEVAVRPSYFPAYRAPLMRPVMTPLAPDPSADAAA